MNESTLQMPAVDEPTAVQAPRRKRSIFDDRVVRRMALVALGLVIFYLVLIVGALLTGVLGNSAPKTIAEKNLAVWRAKIDAGSKDPLDWAQYAESLTNAGQYSSAQSVLNQAKRAKIEDPRKYWLALAQARLYLADKEYEKAVKESDRGLLGLKKQYAADMAEYVKTKKPTSMTGGGLGDNFNALLIIKATAFEKDDKLKEAVQTVTLFLAQNPTAADILEWRGDMYAKLGETANAKADYQAATKFTDQDAQLKEKLSSLGRK